MSAAILARASAQILTRVQASSRMTSPLGSVPVRGNSTNSNEVLKKLGKDVFGNDLYVQYTPSKGFRYFRDIGNVEISGTITKLDDDNLVLEKRVGCALVRCETPLRIKLYQLALRIIKF